MNTGIPIHLQANTKLLRLVREADHWVIWLSLSDDLSKGTCLELYDDGRCERMVLEQDGGERRFVVKPADGEKE